MSDRIEEIRARHESVNELVEYDPPRQMHDDREMLLAEVERLRAALTDMLNGWRYIRETYGDLAGVGWDRAEQKALFALEAKPMSDDTIEDVRARHKNTEKAFSDDTAYETARDIHVDRAFLLAEVDRLTRERDEARAEVGRMKKLHPPLANLQWPARGEAKP